MNCQARKFVHCFISIVFCFECKVVKLPLFGRMHGKIHKLKQLGECDPTRMCQLSIASAEHPPKICWHFCWFSVFLMFKMMAHTQKNQKNLLQVPCKSANLKRRFCMGGKQGWWWCERNKRQWLKTRKANFELPARRRLDDLARKSQPVGFSKYWSVQFRRQSIKRRGCFRSNPNFC